MTDQKLVDELEKALTDEAYDGGIGALDADQFRELVRTLALTAAEVVEKVEAQTATSESIQILVRDDTPTDNERELRRLRNVENDYDTNFPCDGGCSTDTGPEETCSRHGRSPRDLWERLDAATTLVEGWTAPDVRGSWPEPQGERDIYPAQIPHTRAECSLRSPGEHEQFCTDTAWQQEHGRHWWACAVNAPRAEWRGPCDCDLSRDPSLTEHPAALRAAGEVGR